MFPAAQPLVLFAVDRIVVVDADNSWAASAAALLDELCAALPSAWEQLEHIGSTSVPGLAAKPVVDLMAATPDLRTSLRRKAMRSRRWGTSGWRPG